MWPNNLSARSAFRLGAWLVLGTALSLAGAAPAAAQQTQQAPLTWDAGNLQLTRPELELLLQKYEETGRSGNYSNEFKVRARSEADLIRRRLTEGDFQVGDQLEISVEGEPKSPFTLTVGPSRVLAIPGLSELSLVGVLRSELQEKVHAHVARFVKSPTVRTRSFIRLAVMGRVGTPGFRTVASESLISDVIMAAGGPGATANLAAARIERGSEVIWEGKVLQQAISEGRTLDQMSLRSGDQMVVPEANTRSVLTRVLTVIPAVILAVGGVMQIM